MDYRQKLIAKIKQQQHREHTQTLPVVPLEDFFSGNSDEGSIGCNLLPHPGLHTFFAVLRAIRSQPNVQDVLVEIYEVDEHDADTWPFSERVYILSSATREEVAGWMVPVQPDEVDEGFVFGTPPAAPHLEPDMKVYNVWWD